MFGVRYWVAGIVDPLLLTLNDLCIALCDLQLPRKKHVDFGLLSFSHKNLQGGIKGYQCY